jgi:hypothetical protein
MPNIGPYTWSVVAVVAALSILLAVAVTATRRRRKAEELKALFGPEYDRAVHLYGDRRRAEAALQSRRKRLANMGIHELSDADRDRFKTEWQSIQTTAVPGDPAIAVQRADALLTDILRAEGCTTVDPDERKIDLSLMHPNVAEEYRLSSDAIAVRDGARPTPEAARRALMRFSNIFDVILEENNASSRLRRAS